MNLDGGVKTRHVPRLPSFDMFLTSYSPIVVEGRKGVSKTSHSLPSKVDDKPRTTSPTPTSLLFKDPSYSSSFPSTTSIISKQQTYVSKVPLALNPQHQVSRTQETKESKETKETRPTISIPTTKPTPKTTITSPIRTTATKTSPPKSNLLNLSSEVFKAPPLSRVLKSPQPPQLPQSLQLPKPLKPLLQSPLSLPQSSQSPQSPQSLSVSNIQPPVVRTSFSFDDQAKQPHSPLTKDLISIIGDESPITTASTTPKKSNKYVSPPKITLPMSTFNVKTGVTISTQTASFSSNTKSTIDSTTHSTNSITSSTKSIQGRNVSSRSMCDVSTMTPPEPVEKGQKTTPSPSKMSAADGGKAWVSQFNQLTRMDKFVFFEELLNECDETTQEMLVTACKKLPIYFEMEEQEREQPRHRQSSYDEHENEEEEEEDIEGNNYHSHRNGRRSRSNTNQSQYSLGSGRRSRSNTNHSQYSGNSALGDDAQYEEEEEEEEEDEEQADMYGYDDYDDDDDDEEDSDDDDDDDELEESDEDDFVSGTVHHLETSDEKSIVGDRKANRTLIVTYGTDGNDGFLGTLLSYCQCDLLDFLINPMPREFGLIKCFLWYDRKEARINLYLDGPKPTLLMEARCTSRSHGKLEFSGNLPQWHGAMTVFELHQVQASHVSHFNIFDGRRLPVREGHRTERLAQRPHVVSGAGGGVYSRLRSGPLSPTAGDSGPIQLGAVQIKSISTKPREIMVLTPRLVERSSMGGTDTRRLSTIEKGSPPQKERQSKRWDSAIPEQQMLQIALGGERDDLCIMHSREATFDEVTQAYTMDFGERVKTASSKNVILQEHNGDGTTKMMTGKIEGMQYAVDLSYPMSLTHAFAVAIANITTKTISART